MNFQPGDRVTVNDPGAKAHGRGAVILMAQTVGDKFHVEIQLDGAPAHTPMRIDPAKLTAGNPNASQPDGQP